MLEFVYKELDRIKPLCKGKGCFCCTPPWVLEEELKYFDKVTLKNSLYFLPGGKTCGFYDGGSCSVYEKRPLDCRLFPFDLFEKDGDLFVGIYTLCPTYKELIVNNSELVIEVIKSFNENILKQFIRQINILGDIYEPSAIENYCLLEKI